MAVLAALPAAHPLLLPVVGVPSHLLWWVHPLPVAMVAFRYGLRGAVVATLVSAVLVSLGELAFGAGYGVRADTPTVVALTVAVTLTNVLMAGFALYARGAVRRYRTLFDAATSGIIRVGVGGRIRAANPAALSLLGVEWDRLSGRTLGQLPGLEALPEPMELAERSWSGVLTTGPAGAGREVHLAVTAVPHSDPPGYQVLLVDRTTEVAQEREIERQGRLSTLGEALAGTAHELRNPIQIILSYAELGQTAEGVSDQLREDLTAIRDQARKMRHMVAELLGFSRARDTAEAFPLHEVVEGAVRVQRMAMSGRVPIQVEADWTGKVAGNRARVEQILANLLANAGQAVHHGEGRIRVEVSSPAPGRAVVRVEDNGPGVPQELRERIFQPFVTTKPEGEGTGLGLAISRRLAAGMGGDLRLEDSDGGGATFALEMPIVNAGASSGSVEESAMASIRG